MSNVLIGIIGVILFIGLALAGALFLGPQFQESTNNSRAAASVQAVSQVASAANMYEVQEGLAVDAVATLKSSQYLKSIPGNPTGGEGVPTLVDTDGEATTFESVDMVLGKNAGKVCDAIAKQTGTLATDTNAAPTARPAGPAGCFTAAGVSTAFARI